MKRSICSVVLIAAVAHLNASAFAEESVESKPLQSSIALGLTANDGNTDNLMINAGLALSYTLDEKQLLRLAADANYGETDNEKTTDNIKAVFDYQYLFTERTYAGFNTSYESDAIADLDYRWVVAGSLGYYLMKQDNAILTAEAGPALVADKKGGESDENLALRAAQRYERTMNNRARFWQSAEYLPNIDDFEIYVFAAELGVEAPVSEKLNVRLLVRNTYDSDPAPNRERNDVTVIGALAYSLF